MPLSTESPSDTKHNAVNDTDFAMTKEEKRLLALKPASRPSFWTNPGAYLYQHRSEHERYWQKRLIGKRLLLRGREGVLDAARYWQKEAQSELAEAHRTGSPKEIKQAHADARVMRAFRDWNGGS